MKQIRAVLIGFVLVLLASLVLARVHPFGNAGLSSHASAPPLLSDSSIPPAVRHILVTKCADCHSMQSRFPIYGKFAPASWLIERDIVRARAAMNLSLWQTYSAGQQQVFKAEIAFQAKTGRMPLLQYRLIHAGARLSPAQIHSLMVWAQQQPPNAPSTPAPQSANQGNAASGKALFDSQCSGCHTLDKNDEGPRLRNVFGRTSGTAPGYAYSPALQKAHIVWNETTLNQWLADPDAFVPGNNMDFQVDGSQDRRDLIRYLRETAAR